MNKPDVPAALSGTIVESAAKHGAQAIVTACPLCQYNLDVKGRLPILYFTQLLAESLEIRGKEISNFKSQMSKVAV